MTYLPSNRWLKIVLVLIPMLLLSAYSLRAQDGTPEATPIPENGLEPLTVEVDFGSGSFNLPAPTIGLSDLSSYRATLIYSFKGTKAGQPEEWSQTYVMLVNQNPSVRQLTIDRTSDPVQVLMTEMNGVLYKHGAGDFCVASVIQKDLTLADTQEPAGFLTSLIGADEAGSETINGVEAKHYTFDEHALGQGFVAKSTGEVWVAVNGGYIVKYKLVTTGSTDYFGDGAEGVITWDYQLTDVNQPLAIELPKNCPTGMVDAPLLPDAENVVKLPGTIRYTTLSSVTDAAAFYQKELPALGWQMPDPPPNVGETALLDFTKDNQQIKVIITVVDGKTKVHVLLQVLS